MDDFGDSLTALAQETILELFGRGWPASPRNFQQIFVELYEARRLPGDRLADLLPSPPAASPGGAEQRLPAETLGLIVALADAALAACAHDSEMALAFSEVRAAATRDGGFDLGTLQPLLDLLDQAVIDALGTPPPLDPDEQTGGLDRHTLLAYANAIRGLVPLADPDGTQRALVLPALEGLRRAEDQAQLLGHLAAVGRFVEIRRPQVRDERWRARVSRRAGDALAAIALAALARIDGSEAAGWADALRALDNNDYQGLEGLLATLGSQPAAALGA